MPVLPSATTVVMPALRSTTERFAGNREDVAHNGSAWLGLVEDRPLGSRNGCHGLFEPTPTGSLSAARSGPPYVAFELTDTRYYIPRLPQASYPRWFVARGSYVTLADKNLRTGRCDLGIACLLACQGRRTQCVPQFTPQTEEGYAPCLPPLPPTHSGSGGRQGLDAQ